MRVFLVEWPSPWSFRGLSSVHLRGLSPSMSSEFSPLNQVWGKGGGHTSFLTIWLRSDMFHFFFPLARESPTQIQEGWAATVQLQLTPSLLYSRTFFFHMGLCHRKNYTIKNNWRLAFWELLDLAVRPKCDSFLQDELSLAAHLMTETGSDGT